MRREVSTPLTNEKVTYIEFQGDLWVTMTFGFSYSKVSLGISPLLIYINSENMKTLHIPLLFIYIKDILIFNSPNEN